jgi:hypothetical protein
MSNRAILLHWLRGRCQFVASSPEIYCHQDRNHEQCHTEFARHVPGFAFVDRKRIEEFLNECIVCGVQHDTRPQAARLEPHPRPDEADGREQHGEQWKVVPDRCAAIVAVRKQKNGIVPQSPNESRDSGALLDIDLLDGFKPTDGETFDIMGAI